jgi:aldehyde dehydrogenase (NAD+)
MILNRDNVGNWCGRHFINGKFTPPQNEVSKINPANTKHLGFFPYATAQEVADAVSAAYNAWCSWKNTSRVKRSDLFFELAKLVQRDQQILAEIISLETGKSLNEANAEVIESLHMCQWVAAQGRQPCGDWMASEIATKDAYVISKPRGIVAVISPWNFPLAIGSFWTTGPALLEGNVVVHKPSELTPFTAQYAASLYQEAGFPDGVYNLVHGDGTVGATLAGFEYVKSILFTGSAEVGQKIRSLCASKYDRNCSTETGSKSATILFADGDQNLAIEAMVASAFKLSGQRCVSSGRLLIEENIFDNFCDKFVSRVKEISTGDPFETPVPYYGPLISEKQLDRVEGFNNLTYGFDGITVILPGSRLDRPGYYLTPHVYRALWEPEWDRAQRRKVLTEEVFGPHVALIPFSGVYDAVKIYNDTEYGLALGVITNDFRKMRIMRDECNAGMIYFNGGSISAESHLPFGGVNKSGNGMKSAAGTYRTVTDEVAVTVNHDFHIQWAQGMK